MCGDVCVNWWFCYKQFAYGFAHVCKTHFLLGGLESWFPVGVGKLFVSCNYGFPLTPGFGDLAGLGDG